MEEIGLYRLLSGTINSSVVHTLLPTYCCRDIYACRDSVQDLYNCDSDSVPRQSVTCAGRDICAGREIWVDISHLSCEVAMSFRQGRDIYA